MAPATGGAEEVGPDLGSHQAGGVLDVKIGLDTIGSRVLVVQAACKKSVSAVK
jgi:hypothetical protein